MKFGKFCLVGLMGAVLQLVLLGVFTKRFHLPAVGATPLAVEMAVVHNFLWHERFTWRDRRARGLWIAVMRFGRFQAANGIVSIAGSTVVTYLLVVWLNAPAIASAMGSIAICSLVNFALADRWAFAARSV